MAKPAVVDGHSSPDTVGVTVFTVGSADSGKSKLVWRLTHPEDKFHDGFTPIGIDFGKVFRDTKHGPMSFLVWDNGGGRERFRPLFTRLMARAIARRQAPVVFVLLAADASGLEQAIEAMVVGVEQEPRVAEVPKVILATKQDVDGALTVEQVAQRLEALGDSWTNTPVIAVSAKTGTGLPEFLSTLEDLAQKQQMQMGRADKLPSPTVQKPGFTRTALWTSLYKRWVSWALDLMF